MILIRTALSKALPGWSKDEVMSLSLRESVNYLAANTYLQGGRIDD
jgi:hypothetical protein